MDGGWKRYFPPVLDCWPGAAAAWELGRGRGLVVAICFALLLDVTLLVALIWPGWTASGIRLCLLVACLLAWIVGIVDSRRTRRQAAAARLQDPQRDLFLSARTEYLRCNWASAEGILSELLEATPGDVEGRLLLASLLRHAARIGEAKEQLRRLQRWREAARWNLEIRREWELLAKAESETVAASPGTANWVFIRSRSPGDDRGAKQVA